MIMVGQVGMLSKLCISNVTGIVDIDHSCHYGDSDIKSGFPHMCHDECLNMWSFI